MKRSTKYFIAALALLIIAGILQYLTTHGQEVFNPHPTPPSGTVTNAMLTSSTVQENVVNKTDVITGVNATSGTDVVFVASSSQTFYGTKTFNSMPMIPTSTPASNNPISLYYYNNNPQSVTVSTTMSEAVNTGQAVAYYAGTNTTTSLEINNAASSTSCGWNRTNVANRAGTLCAMAFQLPNSIYIRAVSILMYKAGATIGNVGVYLAPDNAGVPSSTVLAQANLASSSVAGGDAFVTFTFSADQVITASTTYWIVSTTTGPVDNVNYYVWEAQGTQGLNGTFCKDYTGTTWETVGPNAYCNTNVIHQYNTANGYGANATTTATSGGYEGIAQATTSVGSVATVQITGSFTGVTGLTVGPNYLTNSDGVISSTPGAQIKKAGIATTSSTLIITP